MSRRKRPSHWSLRSVGAVKLTPKHSRLNSSFGEHGMVWTNQPSSRPENQPRRIRALRVGTLGIAQNHNVDSDEVLSAFSFMSSFCSCACRTKWVGGGPQTASGGVWFERHTSQTAQDVSAVSMGGTAGRDAHHSHRSSSHLIRTLILPPARGGSPRYVLNSPTSMAKQWCGEFRVRERTTTAQRIRHLHKLKSVFCPGEVCTLHKNLRHARVMGPDPPLWYLQV